MAEEEKKLYPLKFLPIAETFAWGGKHLETRFGKSFIISDLEGNEKPLPKDTAVAESLELADLGYRDSQVLEGWLAGNSIGELMDMYVDRIVGENVFDFFGRQFPLCVRFIDARQRTPLMVHPDDITAQERYDHLGKTKFWYVLEANENSRICLGFKSDTDSAVFYDACQDGSADRLLNVIHPKKGDHFLIKPGTVHCAENVVMLEISQSSPLDFCLCNWGREIDEIEFDTSLDLTEALDFIDFKACAKPETKPSQKPSAPSVTPLDSCREFTVNRIDLRDGVHILSENSDSFIIYTCIEGEAELQFREQNDPSGRSASNPAPTPDETSVSRCILHMGETVLVPAEVDDFFLVPRRSGTIIIETFIEHLEEKDSYTGLILQRDEPLI
jgi:mannose-6-phosphate isomerase